MNNTEEIINLIEKQEDQANINDLIFEIYVSSLSDELIALLTSDDNFDKSIMIGVERNE